MRMRYLKKNLHRNKLKTHWKIWRRNWRKPSWKYYNWDKTSSRSRKQFMLDRKLKSQVLIGLRGITKLQTKNSLKLKVITRS